MSSRVFSDELGDWPEVYNVADVYYEVRAWHLGPHHTIGFGAVLIAWGLLGWGVYNAWQENIIGGVAAAVPALFIAYMLCLIPWTRLKIHVFQNGRVVEKSWTGSYSYLIDFKEDSYKFVPQPHSEAENEARKNQMIHHRRRVLWALATHEDRRNNEITLPEPGPPMTFYAGSSELFVIRNGAQWVRIAEFGNDPQARQAARLAAALEFVFFHAKQDAARAQQAALTHSLSLPTSDGQPAPVALPAPEEDYE